MILDIDHFKEVNDTHGHAAGDSTLVHLADIIRQTLSGRNAAIGRWGGEEFAIVVYGEDKQALLAAAENIRSNVETSHFDAVGSITCSIGVSELRTDDALETWFERADNALYTAKSEGRNRVCYE